jgi:hypothetical protein
MKTLRIFIITILTMHCKAQTPIIDISQSELGLPDGYYVKDINNILNQFEGTYIYSNGNTTLKLVLEKKIQQFNGKYYEDLIIGEYQYIENGIEKVNTLSQLNTIYNNQRKHNINGNFTVNKDYRKFPCPQCGINEKRLSAKIRDESTNRFADINMRRTTENGQQIMKIKIFNILGVSYSESGQTPPSFSLPQGEFTLIKQ